MHLKVVSEEWCAVVDLERSPRIELRFRSMSQSNLGEELSQSFRIRHKFLVFGMHGAAAVLYWEIGDRVCVI